jgi:membrane protease YdiL (CAAX protease family)
VIQILIAAGITIVIFGFFWLVATAPVTNLIGLYTDAGGLDADIVGTMTFIDTFIKVLPLLVGLGVIAWGWVRTVEERETGFTSL